jgi:hypothetical protein
MESNQSKIDSLLNNYLETSKKNQIDTQVVSFSPDCIITMLQNTFNDVGRMDIIQNKLIEHFTKDDVLRKLSNKEKRELLTEISSIKGDDRKFIMGFIDMASKNSIIGRLVNELTYNQNQTKTLSVTLSPEREKRREEIISLARDMLDDVYKPKFD